VRFHAKRQQCLADERHSGQQSDEISAADHDALLSFQVHQERRTQAGLFFRRFCTSERFPARGHRDQINGSVAVACLMANS
jgi:hypothetical protein